MGAKALEEELNSFHKKEVLLGRTVQQVVLVYDQDEVKSFNVMRDIYDTVCEAKCSKDWKVVIVGNCTSKKWDKSRVDEPILKGQLEKFLTKKNVINHFSLCSQNKPSMTSFCKYIHSCFHQVEYTPGNIVPTHTVLYVGASKTGKTQAKVRMITSQDIDQFDSYTPDLFSLKVTDHSQQFITDCRKALWHLEIGGQTFENDHNKFRHKALFEQAKVIIFFFDEERPKTLETLFYKVFKEYTPRKFILVNNGIRSPGQRVSQCDVEMLQQLKDAASFYIKLNTSKTDYNVGQLFEKIHELCEQEVSVSTINTTTSTTTTTTITRSLDLLQVSEMGPLKKKVEDDFELLEQLKSDLKKLRTENRKLLAKYDEQGRIIASFQGK